jgi:hypothetical protein
VIERTLNPRRKSTPPSASKRIAKRKPKTKTGKGKAKKVAKRARARKNGRTPNSSSRR